MGSSVFQSQRGLTVLRMRNHDIYNDVIKVQSSLYENSFLYLQCYFSLTDRDTTPSPRKSQHTIQLRSVIIFLVLKFVALVLAVNILCRAQFKFKLCLLTTDVYCHYANIGIFQSLWFPNQNQFTTWCIAFHVMLC